MPRLWTLLLVPLWALTLAGTTAAVPARKHSAPASSARKTAVISASGHLQVRKQRGKPGKPKPQAMSRNAQLRKQSKPQRKHKKELIGHWDKEKLRNHHYRPKLRHLPSYRLFKHKRSRTPKRHRHKENPYKSQKVVSKEQTPQARRKNAIVKPKSPVRPGKALIERKRMMTKPVPSKALRKKGAPQQKTKTVSRKRDVQKKPSTVHHKAVSMAEAFRIKRDLGYAKQAKRKAGQPTGDGDATTGDAATTDASAGATNVDADAVAPPGNMVPAKGEKKPVADGTKFEKAFTIRFKVKFNNFHKNNQALIGTDEHALEIEALGPKFQENSTKIRAWMKTDSGLGPAGHGVAGSDNEGRLYSQGLMPNKWYNVVFQKTDKALSLTVNGETVSSAVNEAGDHMELSKGDFDLWTGSGNVYAGAYAGSGDVGLDGEMGDVTVEEGAAAPTGDTSGGAAAAAAAAAANGTAAAGVALTPSL